MDFKRLLLCIRMYKIVTRKTIIFCGETVKFKFMTEKKVIRSRQKNKNICPFTEFNIVI